MLLYSQFIIMLVLNFWCLIYVIGVWNHKIANNYSLNQNANTVLKHCPVNQIFRVLAKRKGLEQWQSYPRCMFRISDDREHYPRTGGKDFLQQWDALYSYCEKKHIIF